MTVLHKNSTLSYNFEEAVLNSKSYFMPSFYFIITYLIDFRKPGRGEMIIKRIRRWAHPHMGSSADGLIRRWAYTLIRIENPVGVK